MLKKTQFAFVGICLLATFICINIAVSLLGRKLTLDVTNDQRYSIGQETKDWLKSNEKDIYVRLYISADWKGKYQLKEYSTDVLRLLEEYQLASNNKLSIKVIEVRPLSVAAAEAKKYGLEGDKTENWFGLIVSDENGSMRTIPYLNTERKNYLEYDITKTLKSLGKVNKPRVGVLSSEITVKASQNKLDYRKDWPIISALKDKFEFKPINSKTGFIDDDLDVLMIINPKEISELTSYAIDQYLLRGGNLLIFADPLSEEALRNKTLVYAPTGLEKIFEKMGINYNAKFLTVDFKHNRYANVDEATKDRYPLWLTVFPKQDNHKILHNLEPLQMNTSGFMWLENRDKLMHQVLLSSSEDSGIALTIDALDSSYGIMMDNVEKTDEKLNLGVLVEGYFLSSYMEPYLKTEKYISGEYAFRSLSVQPSKVIVVTDSDMLNADLWNKNNSVKQDANSYVPYGGNLTFVERALGYLSGEQSLLPSEKKNRVNVWPLNVVIQAISERIYASEKAEINNELADLNLLQDDIDALIEEQGNIPSVKIVREIENIQRRQLELKQKQEKLKYKIRLLSKVLFVLWLLINFIMPIAFIAIAVQIMNLFNRKKSELAEKIADEK